MAKKIADRDTVFAVADQLQSEGVDPSIIAVQERIGGGSYTTIKRLLDEWHAAKKESSVAVEIPKEVSARGEELVRGIWSAASLAAQKEAQAVKDKAAEEVGEAMKELAGAQGEIARLEAVEAEQSSEIEKLNAQVRALELKCAALDVDARRAASLQADLDSTRDRLVESEQKVAQWQQLADQSSPLSALLAELQKRQVSQPASSSEGESNASR